MFADSSQHNSTSPGQVANKANKFRESEMVRNMVEDEEIEIGSNNKGISALVGKDFGQDLQKIKDSQYEVENQANAYMLHGETQEQLGEAHDN